MKIFIILMFSKEKFHEELSLERAKEDFFIIFSEKNIFFCIMETLVLLFLRFYSYDFKIKKNTSKIYSE